MLDRVTNFHNGSFLFIFALIIAYFFAIYLGDQFSIDILSISIEFVISFFLFFLLKNSRNLLSYWLYIFLGFACLTVSNILLLFYDKLAFLQANISQAKLIQVLYLVPFLLFLISFVVFFVKKLKNVVWHQVAVDIITLLLLSISLFWFLIFDRKVENIPNQSMTINFIYVLIDILILCFILNISYTLNFNSSRKNTFILKRISIILYLIAFLFICICDIYYSSWAFIHFGGTRLHYESLFNIAFFIIFVACLHLKEGEANKKIRSQRKDYKKVIVYKFIAFFVVSIFFLSIYNTCRLYSVWMIFILMILMVYVALTYAIQSAIIMKDLAKKERYIIAAIDEDIMRSLEELRKKNERLRQLSEFDSLTGLLNRQSFLSKLSEMIKTKALGERMDIYSIDINHFKAINDSYGHYVGDEVLLKLSKNIKAILPEGAIISRFGGDDFMIVLKQKNEGHYREFLYYLLNIIAEQISVGDYKIALGAKVGVSSTQTSEILADDLIMQAGAALDAAKRDVNTKYVFYDDIKEIIQEKNYIEILLNSMNFDEEFSLNFQPQYLLNGKKIIGAEALIRWNSPVKGFVSPAKFIPVAEQSFIINTIGKWVAKEAIRQMSYWNKKYGISLKVGINISPKQVDNVNFASDIFGYVEEFGMDPKCVDIELTEASLVNAEEIMQTVLKKFSDKGMSISIDDFGTGFSSMNYIKKYPLDRLKIAKELVDNIAINEIDRDVVKSVITLAKNIELKTIAEGVEDETQLEILRELGCDEIQGYFWGKPMNAKDFEELIRSTLD